MRMFIVLFSVITAGATGAFAQVAVIAHKATRTDTLTHAQLLDYFTGDAKAWADKTPVVVIDLKPQSDVKEAFHRLLGISSSRLKSIWLKKMLLGEGEPPEALKSEEDVARKVGSTPGAIGYVSRAKVNGEVKILRIVGKQMSSR